MGQVEGNGLLKQHSPWWHKILRVSIHHSILCFWPSTGGWSLHNVLVRLDSCDERTLRKPVRDQVFASVKSKVFTIPFRGKMTNCTKRHVNYLMYE